jgi:hypothetical protein
MKAKDMTEIGLWLTGEDSLVFRSFRDFRTHEQCRARESFKDNDTYTQVIKLARTLDDFERLGFDDSDWEHHEYASRNVPEVRTTIRPKGRTQDDV